MESLFAALSPAQQHALLEGPALMPPKGVIPNFIDPPNENALGYAVVITSATLSAIVVATRLYVRIVHIKRIDVEDYLAIAALAVYGGCTYFAYRIVMFGGLYVHLWNVQLKNLSDVLYNINAVSITYSIVVMLLKAGILFEWIHIFAPKGLHNGFYWICHITIWTNVMFYVACTLVNIFTCTPREKIWNKLLLGGKCVNFHALILVSGVINFASDLIILALPQRIIWTLKISNRKRVGISLVFAIGVFGCVCGALRMVCSIRFLASDDVTYTFSPVGLGAMGEVTSGFFLLCIPSVPKALRNTKCYKLLSAMIKTWSGSATSSEKPNSRRGLPSWYKPASRKPKPQDTTISSLDHYGLVEAPSNAMSPQLDDIQISVHTIDGVHQV